MGKKLMTFILIAACVLPLAACGQPEEESSEEQSDSQVESFEESEPSESIPPTQESEEETSQASEPPRNEESGEESTEESIEESTEESRSDSESSGSSNDSGENSSGESGLPEYQPGSIKLQDQKSDDFDFERPYRLAYYYLWGEFGDLLDEEQKEDWAAYFPQLCVETNYGRDRKEMMLVTFVKRYNIPREAFDEAVDKFIARNIERGWDMTEEENEVPNADIIYTFDNEIINYYYRYE